MTQANLKPDYNDPVDGRIVIRESAFLPVIYVTWDKVVIAFAFLEEVRSRKTHRRHHGAGEVFGNRKWATLSGEGRAEILRRINALELGDVGF